MERLNQLIAEKKTFTHEFHELLTEGYTVIIDEEPVLVLSVYEGNVFALSKDCGGVMSYSATEVERVVSYSEEAAKLYEKLWNFC
ncbi:hypothetical protein PMV_176 [Port-miou virus]|uniref:Uncharacterized protein n=1 Tax=Port-miou virus TaxID=1733873 RepID=A0A0N9PW83_9VIRU|nr:hypothetical protein PMV_176 [Port-miou virus]